MNAKVLVFQDHIVPWDKVAYCERVKGPAQVRVHFMSYGFVDVDISWDEFVQQLVLILDAA